MERNPNTHAPISEKAKSLTIAERLQVLYPEAREVAYDPSGWMQLEEARESDSYAAELDASDHGKFWMSRAQGNRNVYKLHEKTSLNFDPIADELEALIDRVQELPPETRAEVLPKNFRILQNLLNERE